MRIPLSRIAHGRSGDKEAADRFTRELIPLVPIGWPTAIGCGRPPGRGALNSREEIQTRVEVVE